MAKILKNKKLWVSTLSFIVFAVFSIVQNINNEDFGYLFWIAWIFFYLFAYTFSSIFKKKLTIFYILLAIAGIIVSTYLFVPYLDHSENSSVAACATGGCDTIKDSEFSHLFAIKHWALSLPFWGLIFYSFILFYNILKLAKSKFVDKIETFFLFKLDYIGATLGFVFSIYLTGIEAFVVHAWCSYCMIQATLAIILFFEQSKDNLKLSSQRLITFVLELLAGVFIIYAVWYKTGALLYATILLALFLAYLIIRSPQFLRFIYSWFVKPFVFLFDAEKIHNTFVFFGRITAKVSPINAVLGNILKYQNPRLFQEYFDRRFYSPVGLSAGFDNNGYLSKVLPNISFGFESVGTTTNQVCEGNPKPRLGRLPKSKSLLVNKGFRNDGIENIVKRINFSPEFPVGISIGATNKVECATSESQIKDIIAAFKKVKDDDRFAYFELNISCPNVSGSGYLATPQTLTKILTEIKKLHLARPLIVKFKAEIEWKKAKELVKIMIKYGVKGIVVSNLVIERNYPFIDQEEAKKAGKGNLSGKPVEEFANKLIENIYRDFGDKILIIGVGGIMSPEDAYKKVKLGASLVQLITGMIMYSPTLIYEINQKLPELLEKDGFKHISEAIGADVKKPKKVQL